MLRRDSVREVYTVEYMLCNTKTCRKPKAKELDWIIKCAARNFEAYDVTLENFSTKGNVVVYRVQTAA